MIRGRALVGALCLALVPLAGGCHSQEPRFCSDLRRIDAVLGPLREAKAQHAMGSVPGLVDAVADVYESIEPPGELQGDWPSAVEFFRVQADNAATLLRIGTFPRPSNEDDARYSRAFTAITDYGIAHCGRRRGTLVP